MSIFNRAAYLIIYYACYTSFSYAQTPGTKAISLTSLNAFDKPGKDWLITADISIDFNKAGSVNLVKGMDVLVNTAKTGGSNLLTKAEFGDMEINLDFLLTKSSSTGVYLEGRYGIKLADSWTKPDLTFADMGAIEQTTGENNQAHEGTVALMNAAKAPGLWQHLKIVFRAPVFKNGVKVKNARFEEVSLNGALIQLENEVTGPTTGAGFKDEKPTGPLMFRGNDGVVAFRNINYRSLKPEVSEFQNPLSKPRNNVVNPIIIKVENKPYLLRSFLMFDNKKRTHVISVGSPDQVSYSYDLKQGALFQVWRGQFLDVTQMWDDRGEPQLARPIGSLMKLSVAPAIAVLADKNTAWPDSIAFDDFQNKGYVLDKSRMPTFEYSYNGADVTDKIAVVNNGESLERTITVNNGTDNFYCRLALAPTIVPLKDGLYDIGDKQYYLHVDEHYKPMIRNTKNGQELIVPIGKSTKPLIYSITW